MHIKCGVPSGVNCKVWHCAAILYVPLSTTSSNTIFLSHKHNSMQHRWPLGPEQILYWGETCENCLSTTKLVTDLTLSITISHRSSRTTDNTSELVFLFYFVELLKVPDVTSKCVSTTVTSKRVIMQMNSLARWWLKLCTLHLSLSTVCWNDVIVEEVRKKMLLGQKW